MSAQEHIIRRHRLTVDEYYRMAEVGILAPDARVELINGEIIDMAPIGNSHASVVDYLNDLLAGVAREFAIVRVQGPIRLGEHSMPRPDLVLLRRRDDFYRFATAAAADALLVVEVCDSSFVYDRRVKVPLYAAHGVPEVWLFELKTGRLHRFSEPRDGAYQHASVIEQPGAVTLIAHPCTVDLSGVL